MRSPRLSYVNKLTDHYRQLLGLDRSWEVADVNLSVEDNRVEIHLRHCGREPVLCPECNAECVIADHAPERGWRHLDTMQFETILRARVPRSNCSQCGVKTCKVPWADKYSRFTLMFEAFAIRVIQACSNVKRAAKLMKLDWDAVHRIMERAVERGLERRELGRVSYVGIDEKSFRRGQSYISLLVDLTGARVLDVSEGRDEQAANQLWESLGNEQTNQVKAVAMDMSAAYQKSAENHAPNAEIVHDRFHISKNLNEAVDKVRRAEHKALQAEGDDTLTNTKRLWLYNPENMDQEQRQGFELLKKLELKTSRAWAIKEYFRWFWEYSYAGSALKFFRKWRSWASRCRLKPMVKVAKTLNNHLDNMLTYFRHPITNALCEGFNSKIQSIKSAARGFRVFRNYRIRILFYCGNLELMP